MKTLKLQRLLSVLIIPALVLYVSCSDPMQDAENDDDNNSNDTVLTSSEADKIADALRFKNSAKVTGTIPTVINSSLSRTNSKDTIFLMDGVKIPIRLSHPEGQIISGIFIAVKGSTFYQDMPAEIEGESDTVSIIIVDIDAGDLDLPADVPAEIVPYDNSKQPIDIIERIITIEEPEALPCDILVQRPGTLTDSTGYWAPEWYWHHTIVFNPNGDPIFINAPGNAHITKTQYEGCCDFTTGKNCNILATTLNASADVVIAYTIMSETFAFFTDGTFVRQTHERKQNFDPNTTDWCAGLAGYTYSDDVVTYQGTHDYIPGDTNISYLTKYSSCELCGYGSPGGSLAYSCHLMVISRNTEGSNQVRVYVRDPTSDWYD
jgi:hypothetical protein